MSKSSEVSLELNIVQREVSVEVKNKARSLEVTRIISRSLEQRFEVQGGSRWGQVDNERGIKVDIRT